MSINVSDLVEKATKVCYEYDFLYTPRFYDDYFPYRLNQLKTTWDDETEEIAVIEVAEVYLAVAEFLLDGIEEKMVSDETLLAPIRKYQAKMNERYESLFKEYVELQKQMNALARQGTKVRQKFTNLEYLYAVSKKVIPNDKR